MCFPLVTLHLLCCHMYLYSYDIRMYDYLLCQSFLNVGLTIKQIYQLCNYVMEPVSLIKTSLHFKIQYEMND